MRFAATPLAVLLLCGAVASATAAPRPRAWAPADASRAGAPTAAAAVVDEDDPDLPGFAQGTVDKEEYFRLRNQYFEERNDAPFDVAFRGRLSAIEALKQQSRQQGPFVVSGSWTAIGPFPIPNGQTNTLTTAVSGRTVAIVVHPTNPDIVYVGTAQGGVYRSLNGGTTWTAIFDNAASLAVSSLALAPSNPTILYVGTGESSGSCDSYFGVGLYRIENADTAPVLNGPFNPPVTTGIAGTTAFTGRAISSIAVHPTNPDLIWVGTTAGIGGIGCDQLATTVPPLALRGIYRSFNATSASPSFEKIRVSGDGSVAPDLSGNRNTFDLKLDPNDPNRLVCWYSGATGAGNGGVFVTTNSMAPVPTFTNTLASGTSFIRGEIAVTTQGAATKWMIATGESSTGRVRRSLDGGNTWSATLGGAGYCGGQCFYDIAIGMPPGDTATVLLGGAAGTGIMQRSVNGGATFAQASIGLHADTHAIAFAPSNPDIVYEGSDGGIYRSNNRGLTWTSLNTAGFSATQFQSIALHPIDPNFSIGGTQDNGTNWYKPDATWTRADFGDGGFTVIDQNALDNTNVTMYHTYFNQTNAMGYARVTNTGVASDGLWTFFGCGFSGSTPNGMTCTASAIQFYAPMARGPGSPNTLYFGSDVLYRSSNAGTTVAKVSQEPIIAGASITAIGISPTNDNFRLVGLVGGRVFSTTTGSSPLTNITGSLPAKYVARVVIDPTNPSVGWATFAGFGLPAGQHIWRTNDISNAAGWTAMGAGIPDVPVNAFVIDPALPTNMYAGTDVGVYRSTDGGATWSPYTTGMPIVAVYDMAIQGPSRILRIATHGRGMWERLLDSPVATQLALVGSEIVDGHARLTWFSGDGAGEGVKIYRRAVPGDFVKVADAVIGGDGQVSYDDADIVAGRSYEYEVGIQNGTREQRLGRVWVDVPTGKGLALRRLGGGNTMRFALSLPTTEAATLEIVDITGRRVREQDLGSRSAGDAEMTIDAGGLRPGIYWARLSQAGKFASVRVALTQSF